MRTEEGLEFRGIVSDVEEEGEGKPEAGSEEVVGAGGERGDGATAPGAGTGAAKTDAAQGAAENGDDVGCEEEYK